MMLSIFALSPSGTRIVIVSFMATVSNKITVRLIYQLLLIVTISSDSMLYDSMKRKQKLTINTKTELSEMKEKVLFCFAENGEMNIYKVGKRCGIGYSTAHSSIKALEKALAVCNCALILVSHNLSFLRSVVATIWQLTTADQMTDLVELQIQPLAVSDAGLRASFSASSDRKERSS